MNKFVPLSLLFKSSKDVKGLTRKDIVYLLKGLKQLALQGNPRAQCKLAQFYPENSSSYYKLMQAAVNQGYTPAMLAMSESLVRKNTKTSLLLAANYIKKIYRANDSFMINEAKKLLKQNASLAHLLGERKSLITKNSIFAEVLTPVRQPGEMRFNKRA